MGARIFANDRLTNKNLILIRYIKMNKNKQLIKTIITSVAIFGATTAVAKSEENVLNFYNWSDYIAEDTIKDFEKETGIKVIYDVFDSNETLEAKLLAGNSGYDLVVPSSHFMALQIKAGVFQPLDKNKLPNISHLEPKIMAKLSAADPENKYGIPYLWGTTGIGYNPEQVAKVMGKTVEIDSWSFIFEPENMKKLAECGVSFLDSADEMIPFSLLYNQKEPNSKKHSDFKPDSPAIQTLKAVHPYVKQYTSSQYINDLANGDSCVAVGFSGDIFQAAERAEEANNGVSIKYVIPKEGSEVWFDILLIPADAEHAENAHKFINYLMRPDVIAKITDYVWYANPNKDATALINKEISSNSSIYPTAEIYNKLFISDSLEPKITRIRNRQWADIKAGR